MKAQAENNAKMFEKMKEIQRNQVKEKKERSNFENFFKSHTQKQQLDIS